MKKIKYDCVIGIDPGAITGYAVWNIEKQAFEVVASGSILEVMKRLEIYLVFGQNLFVIENPNLRKWFGNSGRERLQGAGSIKRDYSIWMEWFKIHNIEFNEIAPKNVSTKINQDQFKKMTGWEKATNSHSRDAGMMVFCRK